MNEHASNHQNLPSDLSHIMFPYCGRSCSSIIMFGAGECEAVCPNKFDRNGKAVYTDEIVYHKYPKIITLLNKIFPNPIQSHTTSLGIYLNSQKSGPDTPGSFYRSVRVGIKYAFKKRHEVKNEA